MKIGGRISRPWVRQAWTWTPRTGLWTATIPVRSKDGSWVFLTRYFTPYEYTTLAGIT